MLKRAEGLYSLDAEQIEHKMPVRLTRVKGKMACLGETITPEAAQRYYLAVVVEADPANLNLDHADMADREFKRLATSLNLT